MVMIATYLSLLLTYASQSLQPSIDVIAVTYNIRMDNPGDNADNWHERKADMVDYLKALQADFVGLQEAWHHQLEYLDEGLPTHDVVGVGRDDGLRGGEYSAILYDTTKWTAIQGSTFWLSETPHVVSMGWDAVCHRVLTYGLFVNHGGDTVLVGNTHFDHVGREARQNSVALIAETLATFGDVPTILMGDFNFTPDDDNYRALQAHLTDAATTGKDTSKLSGTFNGFGPDSTATRRIDYIWHSQQVSCTTYEVNKPKTQQARQLSDHYPVVAHLKLTHI